MASIASDKDEAGSLHKEDNGPPRHEAPTGAGGASVVVIHDDNDNDDGDDGDDGESDDDPVLTAPVINTTATTTTTTPARKAVPSAATKKPTPKKATPKKATPKKATNPPLPRARAIAPACTACRRAKVRCVRPLACDRCIRADVDCTGLPPLPFPGSVPSSGLSRPGAGEGTQAPAPPTKACDRCRRLKSGCVRREACERCAKKGVECVTGGMGVASQK